MSSLIQRIRNLFTPSQARADSEPRADAQTGMPGELKTEGAGKTEPYTWVSTLVKNAIRDLANKNHREDMAELQPCAKLWTRDIAFTVFDNWFEFVNADGEAMEEMDVVQEEFKRLRMEEVLKRACIEERKHGWALIYKVYSGNRLRSKTEEGLMDYLGDPYAFTDTAAPPDRPVEWLEPLPTKCVRVDEVDEWNTPIIVNYLSELHGEVPGGAKPVNIPLHATRCWWIVPRPKDRHWEGYSALSDIWDCLVALNEHLDNMTYYAGKVGFYKEIWRKQGSLNDSEATRMKEAQQATGKRRFEMVKQGVWEEPTLLAPPVGASAFGEQIDKIFEIMSAGTGITTARWKGAQAGELEGSRTNLKLERAVISAIQDSYEPILRAIIEDLFPGQFQDYYFEWIQSEQFDEIEKAELESIRADIVTKAAAVMTRDELRERLGLPSEPTGPTLAEEQQESLKELAQAGQAQSPPDTAQTPPTAPNRADAYAARDAGRFAQFVQHWQDQGYSKNQIVADTGMSWTTMQRWLAAEAPKEVRRDEIQLSRV